jgi:hypothetical protein
MPEPLGKPFGCRCCGYLVLESPPPGTFDECPICNWTDTPPGQWYSGNSRPLLDAQRAFAVTGRANADDARPARPPIPTDRRDPAYIPLEVVLSDFRTRVLARVAALRQVPRPRHSLYNPTHCPECEEHEQTMASNTLESLTLVHVGNPGWDPVCYLGHDGFRYWFPTLARIALEDLESGYLCSLFGFHMGAHGEFHHAGFDPQERLVVVCILEDILALPVDLVDSDNLSEISNNLGYWRTPAM